MTIAKQTRRFFRLAAILALCATCPDATLVWADAPSVDYMFPAGGQRGQTVSIRVGGHYLHGDCPFEMLGAGIEAPQTLQRCGSVAWFEGPVIPLPDSQQKENYPWEHAGELTIADDASLGFRRWRVWTSQGVTATKQFVVGDLPEIVEQEVDGDPIPTHIELPVTINGRIFPREDVDVWTFDAVAGRSYACEVMAERLGSPLDSRLEVRDPAGQTIAENVDGFGRDSFLRFTANRTGRHQIRIHDVNFAGLQQFVYRLTVTSGPYVQHTYPLGGQQGTTTQFRLFGLGVPETPVPLTLPRAAVSYRHRFSLSEHIANPVWLDVGAAPEQLEVEPNDTPSNAFTFELPAVLNGTIDKPGDVDSWQFEAKQNEHWQFDVRAASLGSSLDSVLTMHDATGHELASNDDRAKANPDARLQVKVPRDGRYVVAIHDRFAQRGGANFAYRIHAGPVQAEPPGFQIQLPTDGLTLPRGSTTKQKFTATRQGGFTGSIEIRFDGLPAGVEVTGNIIPEKKNDTQVVFTVAEKAPIQLHRVRLHGVAKVDQREIIRPIIQSTKSPDDCDIDHLAVMVAIPTPFKVIGIFETQYADRGSTFTRHYALDRGGFDGPIQVRLAERQVRHLQGVSGAVVEVPAGQDEFDYQVKLPPWMEIGRTSRTCVMAVAEIEDESGTRHTVSYTSHAQNDQVIILVDPGQLDLQLQQESVMATPSSSYSLGVSVARGKAITGNVRVELILPPHIQGVTAPAIDISANQRQATLELKFAKDQMGPFNCPLVVRATAVRDGHPYTAEQKVTLVRVAE